MIKALNNEDSDVVIKDKNWIKKYSEDFKKRFIKRDRNGRGRYPQRRDGSDPRRGPKGEKRADDRDLDRELRDYWLTQKGGNKGEEGKL